MKVSLAGNANGELVQLRKNNLGNHMCKFVLERGLAPLLLPADYIMFSMFSTRRYNMSESFFIPSGSLPYDSLRYSLFLQSARHVPPDSATCKPQ